MKPRLNSSIATAIAAVAFAAAATTSAYAVERELYDYQSAAGACQGALPAFAGTLRARPLALGNEGAAPAFVTCAHQTDDRTSGITQKTTRVFARVGNTGTGSVTINCTFVHGFGGGLTPTYVTRTATVSAGSSAFLIIDPTDIDAAATEIRYAQWSCSLPPGAVVYYVSRYYTLDVGA